jgi:elongation factor P--beta-lysine ligase
MIAKNGTSTLVARVNVPFLAIMAAVPRTAGLALGQDRRFGFKYRAERG